MTPDERAQQWHRIRKGEARVVVGTRSAVFAPMVAMGLVICGRGARRQLQAGGDAALPRARCGGDAGEAVGVRGGAGVGDAVARELDERGAGAVPADRDARTGGGPPAAAGGADRHADEFREVGKEEIFSRQLLHETQATLDRGEQAIILLNRRGYSFVVMCRSCGEKIECENCAISMTFHKQVGGQSGRREPGQRLECHYCGSRRSVPERCPKCESEHLYYLGAGSQQGEERLQELFPGARIGGWTGIRSADGGDMERLLTRLHSGEINLLVGTQMIAKGHDIHGVTLVGVVGADLALGLPDFRAAERVFQLLTQVAGRAGRGRAAGTRAGADLSSGALRGSVRAAP